MPAAPPPPEFAPPLDPEKYPPVVAAWREVAKLLPYARNARTHSPEQVKQIAASMVEFGVTNPVLADAKGIVAGHGRVLGAELVYSQGGALHLPGGQPVPPGCLPAIDCTGWSEPQRKAYILADNQLAMNAGWNAELLKLELTELDGAGFDLSLIGFDADALDDLLGTGVGADGEGTAAAKAKLAEKFLLPPFTVLNAREGAWQDRKRAWLGLGIQSELGRGAAPESGGANALPDGSAMPLDGAKDKRAAEKASPGGARMPATNYSKSRARGDGRGRAVK